MEHIFQRFPDVGEAILDRLDNKKLVRCGKISKRWKDLTDQRKTIWIRMIEKYIGKMDSFSDDWKKVVFKTPVDMVQQLAIATHDFFKEYDVEYISPLFIAATFGNLKLT